MTAFRLRPLAILAFALAASVAAADDNTFRFVVLSDVHVGRNDPANKRRYDEMVREITNAAPKPLAVFSTGDLTDRGLETEYDNYVAWFVKPFEAAGIPHYGLPGNHEIGGDTNRNTLALWNAKLGPVRQAVTLRQTRFILTCGVPENVTGGYGTRPPGPKRLGLGQAGFIDAEQLAWIRQALEAPESRNARLTIMMNHFPLWKEDFGGYEIQDVDYLGKPSAAGTTLRGWMDTYGVDLYLCGHRHFQAAPVVHAYPSGHRALHVLSESCVMGASWRRADEKGRERSLGSFGYEVYEVAGSTISHYRKIIGSAGFAVIGPTNTFSFSASAGADQPVKAGSVVP